MWSEVLSTFTHWLLVLVQRLFQLDRRLDRIALGLDRSGLLVLMAIGLVLVILVTLLAAPPS